MRLVDGRLRAHRPNALFSSTVITRLFSAFFCGCSRGRKKMILKNGYGTYVVFHLMTGYVPNTFLVRHLFPQPQIKANMKAKTKTETKQVKTPTRGRFTVLAQVHPPSFPFSFSFQLTLNLNFQSRRADLPREKNRRADLPRRKH